MNADLRALVMARNAGMCVMCHCQPATDCHHRLPRSRGGPDDELNLIGLCHTDHMWVHRNPKEAVRRRLTIPGRVLRGVYQGEDVEYRRRYPEMAA